MRLYSPTAHTARIRPLLPEVPHHPPLSTAHCRMTVAPAVLPSACHVRILNTQNREPAKSASVHLGAYEKLPENIRWSLASILSCLRNLVDEKSRENHALNRRRARAQRPQPSASPTETRLDRASLPKRLLRRPPNKISVHPSRASAGLAFPGLPTSNERANNQFLDCSIYFAACRRHQAHRLHPSH